MSRADDDDMGDQPCIFITELSSLAYLEVSRHGVEHMVHHVVKNSTFNIVICYSEDGNVESTNSSFDFRRVSINVKLVYDTVEYPEVNFIKQNPLEFRSIMQDGRSLKLQCRIKSLSSQHEGQWFRVVVELIDPNTLQSFTPRLVSITEPIKVISKPEQVKQKKRKGVDGEGVAVPSSGGDGGSPTSVSPRPLSPPHFSPQSVPSVISPFRASSPSDDAVLALVDQMRQLRGQMTELQDQLSSAVLHTRPASAPAHYAPSPSLLSAHSPAPLPDPHAPSSHAAHTPTPFTPSPSSALSVSPPQGTSGKRDGAHSGEGTRPAGAVRQRPFEEVWGDLVRMWLSMNDDQRVRKLRNIALNARSVELDTFTEMAEMLGHFSRSRMDSGAAGSAVAQPMFMTHDDDYNELFSNFE